MQPFDHKNNPGSKSAIIGVSPTTSADGPLAGPRVLTVRPAWPNPFNDVTSLRVGVPGDADVELKLYDARGRLVRRYDRRLQKGWNTLSINARGGTTLASGVYFLKAHMGAEVVTRKMTVVR